MNIVSDLFNMQDIKYRDFQSKLIPSVKQDYFIGVRTPELRRYAKKLVKENNYESFLNDLPHNYFDENQLHAFIICEIKDYNECINYINKFLPFVDNWATCDQMSPKIFKKHHKELINEIKKWIKSKHTYIVRFGVCMLMQHYLDNDFKSEYLKLVSNIKSNEYYVNMMRAWYFATSLAKQYNETIPYIENKTLDIWTHNKTIRKSIESYRISEEHKEYLKKLIIKDGK